MATPNILTASQATPGLLGSVEATTGLVAAYTCPANCAVKIETAVIANISGSTPNVVTIALARNGVAPGAANTVLPAFTLPADTALPLNDYLAGVWLGDGDCIAIQATNASEVVLALSGTVYQA